MPWLMLSAAAVFGYISVSMFVAAFKEANPAERLKLMKAGFGTLTLCMMGIAFAWSAFRRNTP